MEISTEASLKTHKQTYSSTPAAVHDLLFIFKIELENKRWNWIKHHFRERLTVSMPVKVDVESFPGFLCEHILTLCEYVSDILYL